MMEYDFVAEEADQLKAKLVLGENDGQELDSEELEALDEEEKLVQSIIKKGTMGGALDPEGDGLTVTQADGANENAKLHAYERTKVYRQLKDAYF